MLCNAVELTLDANNLLGTYYKRNASGNYIAPLGNGCCLTKNRCVNQSRVARISWRRHIIHTDDETKRGNRWLLLWRFWKRLYQPTVKRVICWLTTLSTYGVAGFRSQAENAIRSFCMREDGNIIGWSKAMTSRRCGDFVLLPFKNRRSTSWGTARTVWSMTSECRESDRNNSFRFALAVLGSHLLLCMRSVV